MNCISTILFALSANIDSFILGLSYGIKKTKIPLIESLLIGFITLIGTAAALLLGKQALHVLPLSVTCWAGSFLLVFLGCYYVLKSRRTFQESVSIPDTVIPLSSRKLPLREGFFIGMTLSVNNFGIGIGAGISGLSPFPAAFCSLIFSVVFLSLGNKFSMNCNHNIKDWTADLICGIILVVLGVYECFF